MPNMFQTAILEAGTRAKNCFKNISSLRIFKNLEKSFVFPHSMEWDFE